MIKAVIIDDEKHSIETLEWKLNNYCPEVEILATFNDPVKGLEFLKRSKLDILFLDIEMPLLNGFDVLEELGEVPFDVVFTTAYDEFGIQAIKFSALDYLLKPVQNQELIATIKKFSEKDSQQISSKQLEILFKNIREEENGLPGRIALSTKESIEFVEPKDIILCTSDSNYTMIYLQDGRKKLISRTLKEFEEMLSPHNFFRAHHSHLVNIEHVREFVRHEGGYLVMTNKMTVPVSRSRKEELLKQF